MLHRTKGWLWAGRITTVVIVVMLVVYLVWVGLDDASKIGSAGAVVVALLTLVAPYLLRVAPAQEARGGDQRVSGSQVGGSVTMVSGAGGDVRVDGPQQAPATSPSPTPGPVLPVAGDQVVQDSHVGGAVTQIRGVGGDVDLNR